MDAHDQLLLSEGVCRQLNIVAYHADVEKWRGRKKQAGVTLISRTQKPHLLKALRCQLSESCPFKQYRYSATSDLIYLAPRLSGLSPAQAMYICVCVEGAAVDLQLAWRLLNEGARHVCRLENARYDSPRCFYESFWSFL